MGIVVFTWNQLSFARSLKFWGFPARGAIMESTSSAAFQNDDVWELRRDDDGFVYKRNKYNKKKRRLDNDAPPPPSSAADLPDAAEARRREWREEALLKLKTKYQTEIEHWELLSNRLKEMEEKTSQIQRRRLEQRERDQTASFDSSAVAGNRCSEAVLDELLLQVIEVLLVFVIQLWRNLRNWNEFGG